jgi:hypothetical protein
MYVQSDAQWTLGRSRFWHLDEVLKIRNHTVRKGKVQETCSERTLRVFFFLNYMQWFWLTYLFHLPASLHYNSLPSCDKHVALKIHGGCFHENRFVYWKCLDQEMHWMTDHWAWWRGMKLQSEYWGKSGKLPAQLTGLAGKHSTWIQVQNCAPHRTETELWIMMITCSEPSIVSWPIFTAGTTDSSG